MEHSFRIALWMFLLLGFLQARPPLDRLINDFGFGLLRDGVSCSENVTFASPVMGDCRDNSLTVMKDGLTHAQRECTVTNRRVEQALNALHVIKTFYPMETSSNCTMPEARNWTQFLTDCESSFQRFKSKQ